MTDGFISNNKTIIVVVGVAGIVILDAIALFMGTNGVILASSIGGIAALVAGALGFEIGIKKKWWWNGSMEISITLNQTEFIISAMVGPLFATAYFSLKLYFNKKSKWKKKLRRQFWDLFLVLSQGQSAI